MRDGEIEGESKTVDCVLSRIEGKRWRRREGRYPASHMDTKPNGELVEAYPSHPPIG